MGIKDRLVEILTEAMPEEMRGYAAEEHLADSIVDRLRCDRCKHFGEKLPCLDEHYCNNFSQPDDYRVYPDFLCALFEEK